MKLKRKWNQKSYPNKQVKKDCDNIYNALLPVCAIFSRAFMPIITVYDGRFSPVKFFYQDLEDVLQVKDKVTDRFHAVKHIEGYRYQMLI